MTYKILIMDISKCTGCKSCVTACSFAKVGVFNPTSARIQIVKKEDLCLGVPLVCEHCEDAPCIDSCLSGALTRDPNTRRVIINQEFCSACTTCAQVCPFNGIRLDDENLPVICDLCDGRPACADVCTLGGVGAIRYVEASDSTISQKRKCGSKRIEAISSLRVS